ncbi:hypothetical protein AXG93_3384s1480 [Marchantia polymorpha subsp. ruderalis]|uniref:Uncharacterized protein n=1 Tax=Marchantia polymorpha subsp. ruderalis TaxID=1480154 RepID=A0A176WFI9_MARPO|nr:hypothetical protein AXG93_3384s1480 [Marchantia polymorpha subsp. ruderalis]
MEAKSNAKQMRQKQGEQLTVIELSRSDKSRAANPKVVQSVRSGKSAALAFVNRTGKENRSELAGAEGRKEEIGKGLMVEIQREE